MISSGIMLTLDSPKMRTANGILIKLTRVL